MDNYVPVERNTAGIQFEAVRTKIDKKYNDLHDELSTAYYKGLPFRTYGVLDKQTFDKLHGLIFDLLAVEFHEVNLASVESIPLEKYDPLYSKDGATVGSKYLDSVEKVSSLAKEGITLTFVKERTI